MASFLYRKGRCWWLLVATAGGHRGPRSGPPPSDFWGFENKPSKENAKLAFICRVLCVLGGRKIGVILHILIATFIYQSSLSLSSLLFSFPDWYCPFACCWRSVFFASAFLLLSSSFFLCASVARGASSSLSLPSPPPCCCCSCCCSSGPSCFCSAGAA